MVEAPRVVLDRGGIVTYDPVYLEPEFADEALAALSRDVRWGQDHLRMFGRDIPFPRLTAWYGDPGATYTYSGIENEPLPWLPVLADIRSRLSADLRVRFNSALLNFYRTGEDSQGWHADDETELGPEPVIASLSLGETRRFQLRSKSDREIVELELEHGSLLVMSGRTQTNWQHRIPKQPKRPRPRINLTFRVVGVDRWKRDQHGLS